METKYSTLETNYNELEGNYNDVNTNYTALQTNYDEMKTEYTALVEFKNNKDREDKQAMIDKFYMLSDDDKKDVQDNIDKYSIEEIESKLSVICVRNKLDMSEKQEEETPAAETTFSLNSLEQEEDVNTPALISLLRKAKKNEN